MNPSDMIIISFVPLTEFNESLAVCSPLSRSVGLSPPFGPISRMKFSSSNLFVSAPMDSIFVSLVTPLKATTPTRLSFPILRMMLMAFASIRLIRDSLPMLLPKLVLPDESIKITMFLPPLNSADLEMMGSIASVGELLSAPLSYDDSPPTTQALHHFLRNCAMYQH